MSDPNDKPEIWNSAFAVLWSTLKKHPGTLSPER
jgi:hypothetical protein